MKNIFSEIPMLNIDDDDFAKKLDFEIWSTQSSSDTRNDRDRQYDGQTWTVDGIRGKTEVKGVTMRDIKDCYIKAVLLSMGVGLKEDWRPQDLYKVDYNNIDPLAIISNLTVEIEKMMGIYPNIPKLDK